VNLTQIHRLKTVLMFDRIERLCESISRIFNTRNVINQDLVFMKDMTNEMTAYIDVFRFLVVCRIVADVECSKAEEQAQTFSNPIHHKL
jgi:hypothetical protein